MKYQILALSLLFYSAAFLWAAADESALLRLSLDLENKSVSETGGGREIRVSGGEVVPDERFGAALAFGADEKNEIFIESKPGFDFSGGFTFETWVKFDAESSADVNGGFFVKHGTLLSELNKGKMSVVRWRLLTDKFFAEKGQLDYLPIGGRGYPGLAQLPVGQWVRLAVTYDPVRQVTRTWVDGGTDRELYWHWGTEAPRFLMPDSGHPVSLFKGLKNFRVADAKVFGTPVAYNTLPPMQVYALQLPYIPKKQQLGLVIDHIDPDLTFPVEVTVYWENNVGPGSTPIIKRFVLENLKRRVEMVDLPGWENGIYTLVVKAYAQNHEIFRKSFEVANPRAKAGAPVRINPDMSVSMSGKKIFPLMAYRVPVEDFPAAKEMGLNAVSPSDWNDPLFPRYNAKNEARIKDWFAAADKAGLALVLGWQGAEGSIRFRDEKSLLAWYLADEPGGYSLEKYRARYNLSKRLDPSRPTIIVQNNEPRVQETAEAADIVGRDPYPVPGVPFRWVWTTTRQAVESTGGLKPVWIIVCQYEWKRPTLEQLRSMFYLAIVGGANGLGVYSWDERIIDPKTGERTIHPRTGRRGWYVPENPEDYQILKTAISELAAMQSILVHLNDPAVGQDASDNLAIHPALKRAADGDYLFIASDSRQAEKATLTLPAGSVEGQNIHVEGNSLTLVDGKASVELPAYGVNVFRFAKGTFGD